MSIWGMQQSPASLKQGILDEVRRLGATTMEAHYSGGNDEGGVDSVTVFRPVTEENPAFMVYELHLAQYGPDKGKYTRGYSPALGPFTTRDEAEIAGKAYADTKGVKHEVVQVTDDKAPLVTADVGTWEEGLLRLVDDLLSIDFGTWAGDFTAHGVVFADVPSGSVSRKGEQSTYEPDTRTYNGEY